MRLLRDTFVWLLLIMLAAVCVVGAMALLPTEWGPFMRVKASGLAVVATYKAGHLLFWIFVGVLFALLLTLMLTIRLRPARTQIEVQMKDGRVVIMDSAIKKYVRTALADVPGIAARRIDLRQRRGKLFVDIHAQVRSHEPLPQIEERTIAKVKESLASHLGITQLGGVHVVIGDLQVLPRMEPDGDAGPVEPYRPGAQPAEPPAPARAEDRGDVVSLGLIAAAENEGMTSSAAAAEALVPLEPEPDADTRETVDEAVPRRGLFARWRKDKPAAESAAGPENPTGGDRPQDAG
jgi:hypothetical protein